MKSPSILAFIFAVIISSPLSMSSLLLPHHHLRQGWWQQRRVLSNSTANHYESKYLNFSYVHNEAGDDDAAYGTRVFTILDNRTMSIPDDPGYWPAWVWVSIGAAGAFLICFVCRCCFRCWTNFVIPRRSIYQVGVCVIFSLSSMW